MDPVTVLFAVDVLAGILLVAAGIALAHERRPDDPGYTPQHTAKAVQSELERAVSGSRRDVRRSLHPWSPSPKRHSDETP